jgi:hypothetical protein
MLLEINQRKSARYTYDTRITQTVLFRPLSLLWPKLDYNNAAILISSIVPAAIANRQAMLQVALGMLIKEKSRLINVMNMPSKFLQLKLYHWTSLYPTPPVLEDGNYKWYSLARVQWTRFVVNKAMLWNQQNRQCTVHWLTWCHPIQIPLWLVWLELKSWLMIVDKLSPFSPMINSYTRLQ